MKKKTTLIVAISLAFLIVMASALTFFLWTKTQYSWTQQTKPEDKKEILGLRIPLVRSELGLVIAAGHQQQIYRFITDKNILITAYTSSTNPSDFILQYADLVAEAKPAMNQEKNDSETSFIIQPPSLNPNETNNVKKHLVRLRLKGQSMWYASSQNPLKETRYIQTPNAIIIQEPRFIQSTTSPSLGAINP